MFRIIPGKSDLFESSSITTDSLINLFWMISNSLFQNRKEYQKKNNSNYSFIEEKNIFKTVRVSLFLLLQYFQNLTSKNGDVIYLLFQQLEKAKMN